MANSRALTVDDVIEKLTYYKAMYGNIPVMIENEKDVSYITRMDHDCFDSDEGKVIILELEDDED